MFFYNSLLKEKGYPPAPANLIYSYANPHILVKDSILYTAPPNEEFRSFGYKFSTNRLGFREKNFIPQKIKNTFRILVIGDSVTFGTGVSSEHRYTEQLEDLLSLNYKSPKFEVLNFGMGGYATDQEHDLLHGLLKIVKCDMVIIGFFPNDFKMTTKSYLNSILHDDKALRRNIEDFKNSKRTYKTLPVNQPENFFNALPKYENLMLFKLLKDRSGIKFQSYLPNPHLWDYVLNEFMGIMELTKNHNLPPPLVAILYKTNINRSQNDFINPKGDLLEQIVKMQFAKEQLSKKGFVVADSLPLLKQYNKMNLAVSEWDGHPNYLAHYIFAKSILQKLKEIFP